MQNVHVSLSLPCPRVLLIVTTVQSPDAVFGPWLILHSCMVSVCSLRWLWFVLTSMLKRIFCNMAWAHLTVIQHVLLKKILGIFAVSCTVHVNFIYFDPPPLTSNSTRLGLAVGLPRRIDIFRGEKKKKHDIPPTQVHGLFQVFQEKK